MGVHYNGRDKIEEYVVTVCLLGLQGKGRTVKTHPPNRGKGEQLKTHPHNGGKGEQLKTHPPNGV